MSSEEDTELRDMIVQILDSNGVLGRIKAELRASVFLALEEEGSLQDKIPIVNKKLADFATTSDGPLVLSIIREFLEFFCLNFTLSVYDPEVSISKVHHSSRAEICSKLNLSTCKDDLPVLSEIIKKIKTHSTGAETSSHLDFNQLNSAVSRQENSKSAVDTKLSIKTAAEPLTKSDSSKNSQSKSSSYAVDPFFDEPVPSEHPSLFSSAREFDLPKGLDLSGRSNKSMPSFEKKTDKSLSSLQDLPSLAPKIPNVPDWSLTKGRKKGLPSLDLDSDTTDDFFFHRGDQSIKPHSKLSASEKYLPLDESIENSEQSAEDEIEEDLSVGVDDLLSSSSIGDDATTDQSVSQISGVQGIDYLEQYDTLK